MPTLNSPQGPKNDIEAMGYKTLSAPHFTCPYCSYTNIGLGINCHSCGGALTIKDKEKLHIDLSLSLNPEKEEDQKIIEMVRDNRDWLCDCGLLNMNIPKNNPDISGVSCKCSRHYEPERHMSVFAAMKSFGVADDGIPGTEGEQAVLGEALGLLQIATIKALRGDSKKGTSGSYETLRELLQDIEGIKQNAPIVAHRGDKIAKDSQVLIDFLEKYIDETETAKSEIRETRTTTRARVQEIQSLDTEKLQKGVLVLAGAVLIGLGINWGLSERKVLLDGFTAHSISTLTVQEKEWLGRTYKLFKFTPQYDGESSIFRLPNKSDIEYIQEDIRNARDSGYANYQKALETYPVDEIRLTQEYTTTGSTISIKTGEYETIRTPILCPKPKKDDSSDSDFPSFSPSDDNSDDYNYPVPNYNSSPRYDYSPPSYDSSPRDNGGGFMFDDGGAIGEINYILPQKNPQPLYDASIFDIFGSPAYAEENCGEKVEKVEVVLKAPVKYTEQGYEVWDFGPSKEIKKRVEGLIPAFPEYIINKGLAQLRVKIS